MQNDITRKAAQGLETRRKLVGAGRKLFGKAGFAATSTEAIVAAAKVTRGAMYHHFADKNALFDAVVEDVAADILDRIEAAAGGEGGALEGLIAGCRAYLDACLSPSIRRIFLVDAPSVLGPERLREIDSRYALGSLREGVDAALAEAGARSIPADAMTALISGALDEAVLWLMKHDDGKSRERLDAALVALLRRTFAPGGGARLQYRKPQAGRSAS